jgi:hypothetical protein
MKGILKKIKQKWFIKPSNQNIPVHPNEQIYCFDSDNNKEVDFNPILDQNNNTYATLMQTQPNTTTIDTSKINRLEIINHAINNHPIGRLLTLYQNKDFNNIEISLQDDQKTLKIFLNQNTTNLDPHISDNFQIGPEGAYEHEESDEDWDTTLDDGLQDENWDDDPNTKS